MVSSTRKPRPSTDTKTFRARRMALGAVGVALLVMACTDAKAPTAGPIASASPSGMAPVGSAPVAAASASNGTPAGLPSPFHVVLTKGAVQLFPAAGATLALGPGLGTLEADGTLRFDAAFMSGLEPRSMASPILMAGGRWPSLLFATVAVPVGRTGQGEISQWKGNQWVKVGATAVGQQLNAVFPYIDGSVLFVEEAFMMQGYSLSLRGGTAKMKAPVPTKAPPTTDWPTLSRVAPASVDALETGHIFVLGQDVTLDSATTSTLAVERLSTSGPSVIDLLPTSKKDEILETSNIPHLVAVSPTDVWVSTRWQKKVGKNGWANSSAYLAHFDGKSWTEVPSPSKEDDFHLAGRDAKGVIWAVAGAKEIWRRAPGETTWAAIPLPSAWPRDGVVYPSIDSLTVTQEGDALVAVSLRYSTDPKAKSADAGAVLLSTHKPSKIVELPSDEAYLAATRKVSTPHPPTPDCLHPFVLLYTLSKVAPADFDYPATRKALTGHREFEGATFLEFTRDGQRFMGARFGAENSGDWELPKKMVAVIKKGVAGSAPQMVCQDPEGSRVLKIDLKTGALTP